MPKLETVDLEGVEILSTGGPVRALGSPPEGDHYTTENLRAMVDAANDLGDEVRAPARIGHRKFGESMDAALRANPAVGWLANHRLNADGTKYLVDVKSVPKRFAELIKARAYRTRSSEISKITSQRNGKTYDNVVTGLAWLGDKLPAIQTLDDVVALYESDDAERQTVILEEGDPPSEELLAALVGAVTDSLARELSEDDPGSQRSPADTRPMKFSEEQRRKFSEATGLAADKVTDDMLGKAGLVEEKDPAVSDEQAAEIAKTLGVEGDAVTGEKLLEAVKAKVKDKDKDKSEGERPNEQSDELTRRLEAAEKTANDTKEELRVERRTAFVEGAIKEGRVKPGAREKLERLYDKDSTSAREFVAEIDPDEELVREYGSDEAAGDEAEALEKAYAADAAVRLGIPVESIV